MFKAKFQNVARNTKIQSWSKIAKIVKIEKNRDFDQLLALLIPKRMHLAKLYLARKLTH